MKEYFIKLFNYDQFANKLLLKAIIEGNEPEKPVQLVAHLLAAQQIWLNRCKGLPAIKSNLWPDWKPNEFESIIDGNHADWINYLNTLNDNDFTGQLSYQDLSGNNHKTIIADILAHLINHGTHHRAQAGQHLKLAGLEKLPATDYILYTRL
jgi:uncharacterized damage-inducible protein DinB